MAEASLRAEHKPGMIDIRIVPKTEANDVIIPNSIKLRIQYSIRFSRQMAESGRIGHGGGLGHVTPQRSKILPPLAASAAKNTPPPSGRGLT